MKTFCPFFSLAFSTSACHAVKPTSGMDAASSIERPLGWSASDASLTGTNSANVPIRKSSGRA